MIDDRFSKLSKAALLEECRRLDRLINTPELASFDRAVPLEAAHQIERWGREHDAGKSPADWFWLLGWLASKAVHAAIAGKREKALHHVITTAAACRNWHRQLLGFEMPKGGKS